MARNQDQCGRIINAENKDPKKNGSAESAPNGARSKWIKEYDGCLYPKGKKQLPEIFFSKTNGNIFDCLFINLYIIEEIFYYRSKRRNNPGPDMYWQALTINGANNDNK